MDIIDLDGRKHQVTQSGLLYAYGGLSDCILPLTLTHDCAKVADWAGSGKRVAALRGRMAARGAAWESRYDAPHGRRYLCVAYPAGDSTARRVTIAAADGITNLRQYALDSGIPEEELP